MNRSKTFQSVCTTAFGFAFWIQRKSDWTKNRYSGCDKYNKKNVSYSKYFLQKQRNLDLCRGNCIVYAVFYAFFLNFRTKYQIQPHIPTQIHTFVNPQSSHCIRFKQEKRYFIWFASLYVVFFFLCFFFFLWIATRFQAPFFSIYLGHILLPLILFPNHFWLHFFFSFFLVYNLSPRVIHNAVRSPECHYIKWSLYNIRRIAKWEYYLYSEYVFHCSCATKFSCSLLYFGLYFNFT